MIMPIIKKNMMIIFCFQGIRGLSSNAFYENIAGKFKDQGDAISNSTTEYEWNLGGSPKLFYITADVYTSFVMLVGIFFPSCTGKLYFFLNTLLNSQQNLTTFWSLMEKCQIQNTIS